MSKLAVFFAISAIMAACPAFAQDGESLEYKVKAAYLYNFTKFISWPEKSNSPYFNICIVGDDPFGSLIESLENKTALDKPIHVQHVSPGKSLKDCHIAYFDQPNITLDPNATRGLLVVGSLNADNNTAFFARGGMIGFALEDDKVKLRLSVKNLKQFELNVSAKLIEVATLIDGGTQ